jgi:hypothetical protein
MSRPSLDTGHYAQAEDGQVEDEEGEVEEEVHDNSVVGEHVPAQSVQSAQSAPLAPATTKPTLATSTAAWRFQHCHRQARHGKCDFGDTCRWRHADTVADENRAMRSRLSADRKYSNHNTSLEEIKSVLRAVQGRMDSLQRTQNDIKHNQDVLIYQQMQQLKLAEAHASWRQQEQQQQQQLAAHTRPSVPLLPVASTMLPTLTTTRQPPPHPASTVRPQPSAPHMRAFTNVPPRPPVASSVIAVRPAPLASTRPPPTPASSSPGQVVSHRTYT